MLIKVDVWSNQNASVPLAPRPPTWRDTKEARADPLSPKKTRQEKKKANGNGTICQDNDTLNEEYLLSFWETPAMLDVS